ncbi:MAG: TIGR03915 family putative DNA repair protein [Deferribacterales bacterium]
MYQVIYDGSFDGFLTLYSHFENGLEIETIINLNICNSYQPFIFSKEIKTDLNISNDIIRRVLAAGDKSFLNKLFVAQLCDTDSIELKLLEYVKKFFDNKDSIHDLSDFIVMDIERIIKKYFNERHKMLGFIRFSEVDDGTMVSFIKPKYNLIPLLGNHFMKRFPSFKWGIVDRMRNLIGYYDGECYNVSKIEKIDEIVYSDKEVKIRELWRAFFKSIVIDDRISYQRQKGKVPLRVREDMVEFKNDK